MKNSPEERSEITPEQNRDLTSIFGEWNPKNIELVGMYSDWDISNPIIENGVEKYKLNAGDVRLDFAWDSDHMFLSWQADLPNFLKSDTGDDGYLEFTKFITRDFPSLFYDFSHLDSDEVAKLYQDDTLITLTPDVNNLEKRRLHGLRTEDDREKFTRDYFENDLNFDNLNIVLKPRMINEIGECFIFISDPNDKLGGTTIDIVLPLTSDGVEGWRESAVKWALDTHVNKNKLIREIADQNLFDTIFVLSDHAYEKRYGYNSI